MPRKKPAEVSDDQPDNQPQPIPDWDGKRVNVKSFGYAGKPITVKSVPSSLAELFEKVGGRKGEVARALGYSGWNPVEAGFKKDENYRRKWHPLVIKALRGEIPGRGADMGQVPDTFKTGFAITLTGLGQFDRVEEIADVIGGQRVFQKNTKAGLIIIYKFLQRERTEKFKRLASRDAEIVCP